MRLTLNCTGNLHITKFKSVVKTILVFPIRGDVMHNTCITLPLRHFASTVPSRPIPIAQKAMLALAVRVRKIFLSHWVGIYIFHLHVQSFVSQWNLVGPCKISRRHIDVNYRQSRGSEISQDVTARSLMAIETGSLPGICLNRRSDSDSRK